MLAANADVWAPGDSFGIPSTTTKDGPPHLDYRVTPQNVALGIAGLVVIWWAAHHLTKRRGRRR